MPAENPAALWAEALRREAEELLRPLAPGAALRWARGSGLLITDACRRGLVPPDALAAAFRDAGWFVRPEGPADAPGMLRLAPRPERFPALEAEAPPGEFSGTLARFRGLLPGEAELECLLEGLKLSALPGDAAALAAWEKRVRQLAALALRRGGGGGLYACGLLLEALRARESGKQAIMSGAGPDEKGYAP